MMRTFGGLLVAGLAGTLALKVFGGLLLPLLGVAFGLLAFMLKAGIFLVVAYIVFSLFRRERTRPRKRAAA